MAEDIKDITNQFEVRMIRRTEKIQVLRKLCLFSTT